MNKLAIERLTPYMPTLQTVLMVEKTIKAHSGEYSLHTLWKALPRRISLSVLTVIVDYLQSVHKVTCDDQGLWVYIWNPELVDQYKHRRELTWNAR